MMPPIVIYSRHDCHLCEEAQAAVAAVAGSREVTVIDVDSDPALAEKYGLEVPVVFVNGRKAFKYRVDPARLADLLERAEAAKGEEA